MKVLFLSVLCPSAKLCLNCCCTESGGKESRAPTSSCFVHVDSTLDSYINLRVKFKEGIPSTDFLPVLENDLRIAVGAHVEVNEWLLHPLKCNCLFL